MFSSHVQDIFRFSSVFKPYNLCYNKLSHSPFLQTAAAEPAQKDHGEEGPDRMETTAKAFHDNHFNSIQALRGISALFIILEHMRFLNCGAFGVDIFFCISGFMIMFSTHKGTEGFLVKRLIRILPLYYIMTVGTYLLLLLFPSMFEQTKASPVFLIKSLLFIPFDIGYGILQPLMRIGWTVNCEIFFYLLFFVSFHISRRYRGLICGALLGGIVLLSHVLPVNFAPLRFYGDYIMLEFILGILCYYIAEKIYSLYRAEKLPRILSPICMILSAGIFLLLIITKPSVNLLDFRRPLLWGLPAMLLVLCWFTAGLHLKMPAWAVRLGDMSFSVYLTHYYPVMFLDRIIFDFSVYSPFAAFGVLLSILICLILAFVSWLLIEKRFGKWLLGHILRQQKS